MKKLYLLAHLLVFTVILFAQAPTVPSANLLVNNITGNSASATATNGDGERRILVISLNPIVGVPQDGIDYNSDPVFGTGDEIAPGEFVVLDNTRIRSSSVRGLQPSTTYYLAAFEYNGFNQTTEYLTPGTTVSFNTLSAPTVQATDPDSRNVTGNSATLTWTRGNGEGRIILMKEGAPVNANPVDLENYFPNQIFGLGAEIGDGNFTVYNTGFGADTTVVTRLSPATEYYFRVFEWNGSSGRVFAVPGAQASFTTAARPTQLGALRERANGPGACEAAFDYQEGNGRGRVIVIREGDNLVGIQPTDGQAYTADRTFGLGDQIGPDAFVVQVNNERNGSNRFFSGSTVFGLSPATTYVLGMYDFDYAAGTGGAVNYQTGPPPTLTFTTPAAPTDVPTDVVLSENAGNSIRIGYDIPSDGAFLVLKEGSAVDFVPTDCTRPSATNRFGGVDLGGGNFGIAYAASAPFSPTTGLTPGVEYHGAVFAYNGSNTPVFNTSPLRFNFVAALTPSESATNLRSTQIEGDRFNANWTIGNGSRRLLIAKLGSAVTAEPQDSVSYVDGGRVFGAGTDLGDGNFVIADTDQRGIGGGFFLTGLAIGTEYHLALFEYNEASDGNKFYRRTDPARGTQSTLSAPATPAPPFTVNASDASSATFLPSFSDGTNQLVVMTAGSSVTFTPENLVQYRTSPNFGNQLVGMGASGVAYRSSDRSPVNVTGLLANTTYTATVFAANGRAHPVYNPTPTSTTFTTATYASMGPGNFRRVSQGATAFDLNFGRGTGTGAILVAREASTAEVLPVDGTTYQADELFGAGSDLGGGNFVIETYDLYSPGRTARGGATGLDPNTEYTFTAYETTTDGTQIYYRVPGESFTDVTVAEPTQAPVGIQITDVASTTATIGWTTGNGAGELVLVSENAPVDTLAPTGRRLAPTPSFGSANPLSTIGNAQAVALTTRSTTVDVRNLRTGTRYYVQLQAYNGRTDDPAYMQTGVIDSFTTVGPPAIQSTDLRVTSSTPTTISLAWGAGGGTDRLLVGKLTDAVDAEPVDGTVYTPNTFFGSGDDLGGGNFAIVAGDLDTITLTDLTPGATYCFAVYEYNSAGNGTLYNTTEPTTVCAVAEQALPVTWSYFRGRAVKGDAHLSWATDAEVDAAYFAVERGSEGDAFTEIGRVIAGPGTYEFVDPALPTGTQLYRLRQVDLDGAFSYSEVLALQIQAELLIYPNPVRHQLQVRGAHAGARLELKSSVGELLLSTHYTGAPVDVSALSPGTYLLTVGNTHQVFIKQ